MKFPKRLDLTRSCFYQLPPDIDTVELNKYEIKFRDIYPGVFHSRSDRYFFFQLPTRFDRDEFLLSLEGMAKRMGLIFKHEIVYPS